MQADRSPAACSISPGEAMVHRDHGRIPLPQPFWGRGRRKLGHFTATLSLSRGRYHVGQTLLPHGSADRSQGRTGMMRMLMATLSIPI